MKINIRFLAIGVALFQCFLATRFGLGVDEAHYMNYSKHLDWSYFDHPPLVGWSHWLFNLVFGWNEFAARIPAILLGGSATVLCHRYLLSRKFSEADAFRGACAFSISFMIFGLHLFLLPDTFLIAGLFVLIWICDRLVDRPTIFFWILLGSLLGVMGLAKYTAILFVPAVIIFLAINLRLKTILSVGPYLSVITAILFVSPVIYWNWQRNWISFQYQMSHVAGGSWNYLHFFESLAGQMGAYNPFLFPFSVAGFLFILRKSEFRLEMLLASTLMLFFLKSSFGAPILPHWTVPFFCLVLPVGVAAMENWKKFFKVAAGFAVVLYLLIATELSYHWIPGIGSAYRDIKGYTEINEELSKLETLPVAVTHWTTASRIMFYSESEVYVLDDRSDQFDLWASPVDLIGKDFYFLNFSFDLKDNTWLRCKSIEKLSTKKIEVGMELVYSVEIVLCRSFEGHLT